MMEIIRSWYHSLPDGPFKGYMTSLVMNIYSMVLTKKTGIELISWNNISYRLYINPLIENKALLREVKWYVKTYPLKKGDIVVDGGAYNGIFTIYAALEVGPSGRVIAFEPNSYNALLLKRNLRLNQIHNVTIIKKGLYSCESRMKFEIQAYGSKLEVFNNNIHTLNTITVTTLDKELNRLHLPHVDFIKMDIEGAEIEAVKGCQKILKQKHPLHFAIASYHLVNGKATYITLEKIFKKLSFKVATKNLLHRTTYADLSK